MPLKLYNTLTRQKDEFTPRQPGQVGMYVCGPTVYARPHIGNARSVVVYDVLYRLLMHLYGEANVTYVRNITDVDDKINAAAKEEGISIQEITARTTQQFHEDIDALNVLPSTERALKNGDNTTRKMVEPRATLHVPQMLSLIEKLVKNGNAYVAEGHVLFSVKTNPKYGQLSRRIQEDLVAGARVQVESYKRDAGDFVLWKPAEAGDDPSSVFDCGAVLAAQGVAAGRPGWHIECSAMSGTHLGLEFDIHGGGADLMFPHHENEIAQSCCAHPGSTYAKFWVHNGFLTVNGEKMSKSLGNFITVRDLLDKGVHGEVIRLAFLKTKYSEPLDWSDKLLSDAKKELDGWYRKQIQAQGRDPLPAEFIEALCDDMNTPKAISLMHSASPEELGRMLIFLGLECADAEAWFKGGSVDENIKTLIDARTAAKKAKNWAEADRIRKELSEAGIILEDKPDGTTDWRRA